MPIRSFLYRLFAGLAFVSIAVIAFQVLLTQLFSITQWYHFAFMIVSLAMLGLGASGTLLAVFRNHFYKHIRLWLSVLPILCGIFIAATPVVLAFDPFRFDSYLLFVERREVLSFAACLFFLTLPFIAGGLFNGLVFFRYNRFIGRLYFFDLMGAGTGSILAIGLLILTFPWESPALLALFPVIAGLLLLKYHHSRPFKLSTLVLAGGILIGSFFSSDPLPYSQYKDISRAMDLPEAEKIHQSSSPHGLFEMVQSPALRYAPGLSLTFTGEIPVNMMTYSDGNGFGPVFQWEEGDEHLMDYSPRGLSYHLTNKERALVLGGIPVNASQALNHDFRHITATQPDQNAHKATIKALDTLEGENYLLSEKLEVKSSTPRLYLSSQRSEGYDLIKFPSVGQYGGGAGLDAISEQFELTRGAFDEAFGMLNEEGLIQVSAWMDYPYRAPLKMAATLTEVLEARGIEDYEKHLFGVRSWGMTGFFLSKAPLDEERVTAIREFCQEKNFDPVLLPDLKEEERTYFNDIQDRDFFVILDEFMDNNHESVYRNYGFNLEPATDRRPYFYQFLQRDTLTELEELFGEETLPFFELGYALLVITFIITAVLSILLIILPLLFKARPQGNKSIVLLYFIGIGGGYMFVEMSFIQQLILLLGNPAYSVAFVIAFMLFCSGVGSYYSNRLINYQQWIKFSGLFLLVWLAIYAVLFPTLIDWLAGSGWVIRIAGVVFLVGIPAFFMGLPFPLGIRYANAQSPSLIPWAWAINGCISVISTTLATFVMIEWGADSALWVAALCYLLILPAGMGRN